MINKRILILAAIIVVILAVAFFFLMPKSSPLNYNGTTGTGNTAVDLFTQAFTGSASVKCVFNENGNNGTAYIKQGKIRFDSMGTEGEEFGNAIINGNILYVWQTGNNEGFKFDTSSYQGENGGQRQQFMDAERIRSEVEKSNPNCVRENIDNAIFAPPASVKFTDYSQVLQQMQNPAGGNMTQQQYQQLLEQYGQ